MYVAWYKILHISYQVHKLDKNRTENEAGEAKGAITYSFCSKNNFKKTNVMLIIIMIFLLLLLLSFSILIVIMIIAKHG